MINYYAVLQVDPRAEQAVIKSAYRTLMKDLKKHPDVGGDLRESQLINEAYAHLTDPHKKRIFDQRSRLWNKHEHHHTHTEKPALIRCTECNTLNRVYRTMFSQIRKIHCGKCGNPFSYKKYEDIAPKDYLKNLTSHLIENKWERMEQHDSFYDYAFRSTFFLKNFIYLKKVTVLSPQNVRLYISSFRQTLSTAIAPTGHYCVLLAQRTEYSACILSELKRKMRDLSGWSYGVVIPVDLQRRKVFLSHIEANRHPRDILNLNKYIFTG